MDEHVGGRVRVSASITVTTLSLRLPFSATAVIEGHDPTLPVCLSMLLRCALSFPLSLAVPHY